jgi:hypothetical protein
MFLPGRTVLASGSVDFPTARDGMRSPLARKLFGIDGACPRRFARQTLGALPRRLTRAARAQAWSASSSAPTS